MSHSIDLCVAIADAVERSKKHECTTFVNAKVRANVQFEISITYELSDWYSSDATVVTVSPRGDAERSY